MDNQVVSCTNRWAELLKTPNPLMAPNLSRASLTWTSLQGRTHSQPHCRRQLRARTQCECSSGARRRFLRGCLQGACQRRIRAFACRAGPPENQIARGVMCSSCRKPHRRSAHRRGYRQSPGMVGTLWPRFRGNLRTSKDGCSD